MKPIHLILPIKYKGSPIQLGFKGRAAYYGYKGNFTFILVNPSWFYTVIGMFVLVLMNLVFQPQKHVYQTQMVMVQPEVTSNPAVQPATLKAWEGQPIAYEEVDDVMGYMLDYFEKENIQLVDNREKSFRNQFLVERQLLVTKYLIEHKVSRVDQLENQQLLELNQNISKLFTNRVLNNLRMPEHVHSFFTDSLPLKKIETSLMEQARYNIPASIKLAQAALETAYGRKVVGNNFFGIKDKAQSTTKRKTIEYYNEKEVAINKNKILSKQKVMKNGRMLYKCVVKDHFSEYTTPWQSFRAHSKFLSHNNRYSPLFTKGKNYEAWASKIGSSKYGGVGYATEPVYGQLLKKIIKRYHLDLLDF